MSSVTVFLYNPITIFSCWSHWIGSLIQICTKSGIVGIPYLFLDSETKLLAFHLQCMLTLCLTVIVFLMLTLLDQVIFLFFCQPVVIGANSMATEVRNLGCKWRRELYWVQKTQLWHSMAVRTAGVWSNSIVLQLPYKAAQVWDGPGVGHARNEVSLGLDTSAAPALVCSTLTYTSLLLSTPVKHLRCLIFGVSVPARETEYLVFDGK